MELNNLKTESLKIRMTADEKAAMKASIFGVASPLASQPSSYFSYSFHFFSTRALVPLSLVLVVLVSSGTAAAAQSTLPGDLLYPVKVSVNEALEVALATTPVARAEVSAKLAQRRVEEAETLAAQGKLNPAVGEALAASFESHAQDADKQVEVLETEDPEVATELRAKLDSSLLAHGEILATLTVGGAKENQEGTGVIAAKVLARTNTSARAATAPIAMRVAKTAPTVNQTMSMSMVASDTSTGTEASGTVSLENDMVAQMPRGDEQTALRAQARAEETLADVRELFDGIKDDLSPAVITQVSGELVAIRDQMELGSTTLAEGHFDEARSDYTEALARATKLYVLLKAQTRIEQNIITPILKQDPTEVEAPLHIDLL